MSIIDCSRQQKTNQNDLEILKKIYKYTALFGIAPDPNSKSLSVCRTLITSLLIALCFVFTVYFTWLEVSSLLTLVNFSSKIFGAIFAVSCIFNPNVVHRKKWILFVKRLSRLESAAAAMMFEPKPQLWVEIGTSIAVVFAFTAYNIRIISYYYYFIYNRDNNFLRLAIYFYVVGFFVLFYSTVIFLKSRYAFALNYLPSKRGMLFCSDLKKFSKFLIVANDVNVTFNQIFGWALFFYVSSSVLFFSASILFAMHNEDMLDQFWTVEYAPFVNLMILCYLAITCESVEILGRKIVTVCYQVSEEETDNYIREKLFDVASLAEHMKPRFSAAGFFSFNQSCLIMIFSFIINYLVIIIEFDVAVQ